MISMAAIDLVLGLVNAGIKLGGRADRISVQHELGQGLPFLLPPAPPDLTPLIDPMEAYFHDDEEGRAVLMDEGLTQDFDAYYAIATDSSATLDQDFVDLRTRFIMLYATIKGQVIPLIGNDLVPPADQALQMSVQYYIVESAKPGIQRSAVVDIALATADVALEFVGNNPGLITRDQKMQGVIATFLTKFTAGDLEEMSAKQLFERMLSSVILTAIEKRDLVEDIAPLALFLEAIDDVQKRDPDFVAGMVAGKGFDRLLQSVLVTVGDNLNRFTDEKLVVDILGDFLRDVATDEAFTKILKGDTAALAMVAQIAIEHAAMHPVLLNKISGKPLWQSVLKKVMEEVGKSAKTRSLFQGETLGHLAQAALSAVAEHQKLLEGDFIERLVAAVADGLRSQPVEKLLTEGSLRVVAERALLASAENIDLLVSGDKLLQAVLANVMTEGAKAFREGFTESFAVDLVVAALEGVGGNVHAIDVPESVGQIIGAIIGEFARDEIRGRLTRDDIPDVLVSVAGVVAANPHLWEKYAEGKLPAAVVRSIATVVAEDPTRLLSGPVLADLIINVLDAVSMRAQAYARVASGRNPELTKLLQETLKRLKGEVGIKLGAQNIVAVIVKLVLDWGEQKFLVDSSDSSFKTRVSDALKLAA